MYLYYLDKITKNNETIAISFQAVTFFNVS